MELDSLVRIRQLNNPEISGYVVDIIDQYLLAHNIGQPIDTGAFFLFVLNLSGYVTSGDLTGLATKLDVSGNNLSLLAFVDANYYPRSNPSGFMGTGQGDARYLRGNHFQNQTDFQLYDSPNGIDVINYVTDDTFVIQGFGGAQNVGKIIFADSILPPSLFGFNFSGSDVTAQTINGEPVIGSGYIINNFIPTSKVTAGQAGNGFQYILLQDTVKSTQFLFEQGANFYMQGRHNVNVSAPYVIDLYGSTGPTYGFPSGQPFIRGFYINADKLQVSGNNVLSAGDISASGLALYSQLTGASGILHDADGTLSTRLVNTGSYLYNLMTGVSGQGINSQTLKNVVFQTGDQFVSGVKTFLNNLNISGDVGITGTLHTDLITTHTPNDDIRIDVINRQLLDNQPFPSVDWGQYHLLSNGNPTLDWSNQILTGTWNVGGLTINGSGIPDFSKVVFKTGDQTIGGNKAFTNNVSVQGIFTPQFIQTYDVLSEGTIYDLASVSSLKWETRKLLDGTGGISVDWASRILSGNWSILSTTGVQVSLNNLVLLTTDQNINGNKSFIQTTTFTNGLQGPIDGGGHLRWSIDSNGDTIVGRRTVSQAFEFNNQSLAGYDGALTSDSYPLYYFDHGNHFANFYIPLNVSGDVSVTGNIFISGQHVTTGGPYYPLNSNPSGYVTAAQAGGVQNVVISGATLSGNITFTGIGGLIVSRTGQTIYFSGGAGSTGTSQNLTNVVFTTGDQTISGNKSFANPLVVSGNISAVGANIIANNYANGAGSVIIGAGSRVAVDSGAGISVDWQNRILSGFWNVQSLTISGVGIITANQTGNFLTSGNLTNMVYTTGDQAISGNKSFANSVVVTGNITAAGGNVIAANYQNSTGGTVLGAGSRVLLDVGGNVSEDFTNRILSGTWTAQALNLSGVSVTTGGPYYPLSNPAGYITASQAGILSINVTGLNISGALTFTGINGIQVSTGNSSIIRFDGSSLVQTSQTGSFITTGVTGQFASSGALTVTGQTLLALGASLQSQINGISTGVQTLNVTGSLVSGAIILTGAGNISIFKSGQLITISGASNSGSQTITNVVFTTGNQNISGIKNFYDKDNFLSGFNVNGNIDITGTATIRSTLFVDSVTTASSDADTRIDIVNRQLFDSTPVPTVDWGNGQLFWGGTNSLNWQTQQLTGTWDVHAIKISGQSVTTGGPYYPLIGNPSGFITTGQTGSFGSANIANVVYATGDQAISGNKSFASALVVSGNITAIGGNLTANNILNAGGATIIGGGSRVLLDTGASITVDWQKKILSGTWDIQAANLSGISVTTGGPYYPLSNPAGYITSAQAGGIQSVNITGLTISGALIFTGINGLQLSTGNASIIRFDGSSFVQTSQTGSFITTAMTGSFITTGQTGGFGSANVSNVVFTTGDQTGIFGWKNFAAALSIGTGISGNTPRGIFDIQSGNVNLFVNASGTLLNSGSGRFSKNLSVVNIDLNSITNSSNNGILIIPGSGKKVEFVMSGANLGMIGFRQDAPIGSPSSRMFQFANANASTEFFSWDIDTSSNPALNLHNKDFLFGKAPAGVFSETIRITNAGKIGIGISAPTAFLHLTGSSAANSAALKINAYGLLATPESGAIEFDGTSLYYTDSTATRRTLSTGASVGGGGGGVTNLTASGTTISGAITLSGQGVGIYASGQNIVFKNYVPSISVNTTINWSSGNTFGNTLTGNTIVSFVGQQDGQSIMVAMTNASGNGFLVTWPTGTNGVRWPNGTAPIQSSGNPAAVTDIYTFIDITGQVYGNVVQKFY